MLTDRLRMVGEGFIPKEVFSKMPDGALWIFLEEWDPEKWPKEMLPLLEYVEKFEEEHPELYEDDILEVTITDSKGKTTKTYP